MKPWVGFTIVIWSLLSVSYEVSRLTHLSFLSNFIMIAGVWNLIVWGINVGINISKN